MLMQILAGNMPQTIIIPQETGWTGIAVALSAVVGTVVTVIAYRRRNK